MTKKYANTHFYQKRNEHNHNFINEPGFKKICTHGSQYSKKNKLFRSKSCTTFVEDELYERPTRFDADCGEDFQLWALRFEVLADAKECSDGIFKDSIGDQDVERLESAVQKRVWKARYLQVMCLGTRKLRTDIYDWKSICNVQDNK